MRPGVRLAGVVVAAQILVQVGAFTLPALLPALMTTWALSATEAGWLVGAFFAAYVPAVPVLVALTDRYPARRIYLAGAAATALSHFGFVLIADGFWVALALRALAGLGWACCYMPGLKLIADRLEGTAQSRAVSWHAAGVGIAGALSFATAGFFASIGGPMAAFLFAGLSATVVFAIGVIAFPRAGVQAAASQSPAPLLDFRPVLRNRWALAWIAGYTAHTWELAALRAWGVTFLTSVAALHATPAWMPGPVAVFTMAGLLGVAVSVAGNEAAQRFGRPRVVAGAMGAAAALSVLAGFSALVSAPLAALCVLAWNAAIYLDSSALTAGTVQAADRERRGATMGLHSMCGYAGGFLGPVGIGLALDLTGGETALGWLLAFGLLAPVTLLGLLAVRHLGRAA